MAAPLAGLPDAAEHRTPPATQARQAMIDRLRSGLPAVGAELPLTEAPRPEASEPEVIEQPTPREPAAPRVAPTAPVQPPLRQTPEAMLDAILQTKSPEQVVLMTMEKMPANHVLTTKVGKWTLSMKAVSCTVDDTQLNFIADKRQNQALPDAIAEEYQLTYLSKEYSLRLLGVSFFPSPNSPFVLVSFLRTGEPTDQTQ